MKKAYKMTEILTPPEGQTSFSGIPTAQFVEDVDSYMKGDENAEHKLKVWKNQYLHLVNFPSNFLNFQVLDERHQKYKFMEQNLTARKRRLKSQLPDITSSLAMIGKLRAKKESKDDTETKFLLSDSVYASAMIPPTDKVSYTESLFK